MPQLRLILGVLLWEMASALTVFDVWTYYTGLSCRDVPKVINAGNFTTCRDGCEHHSGDWTMENEECQITDYNAIMAREFTNTSYIVQESLDVDCESVLDVYAYIATGTCELAIMYVEDWGFRTYRIAQREGNGSLSARYFSDSECLVSLNETQLAIIAPTKDTVVDPALVGSNSCDENNFRWSYYDSINPYVPASNSSSSSSATGNTSSAIGDSSGADLSESVSASSSNSGVIIAGIAGGVVVVQVVLVLVYRKQRSKRKNFLFNRDDNLAVLGDSAGSDKRTSSTKGDSNSLEGAALGQSGLWNDDVITAKRIARREIQVKNLISRGAFGEVYEGVFNDKRVAVKMLSPEIRGRIRYVNNFLAEAKLTASMEHPHVVHFIGVAWDTLSDLCVVMEFMEGGDLRSLLSEYEQSGHPVGIDREKATIALHVCHALTYLHSLAPPIIHRDLKSRNILLTHDLKAKVTDFGISREKLDQTMTAGVGTSLWMAPEVMLGERYDDKADIFSFGVVLSELDLHTLPYAQAKDKNRDSNGHRFPDALLLQQVAMGKLRVEFSEGSPRSLVEVGVACVSVDPRLRPTAAEALYKLQKALTQELKQLTKTCE